MNCPICACADIAILSTRPTKDAVHRRRACSRCGHRWNTTEIPQARLEKLTAIERHAENLAEAVAEE